MCGHPHGAWLVTNYQNANNRIPACIWIIIVGAPLLDSYNGVVKFVADVVATVSVVEERWFMLTQQVLLRCSSAA